MCGIEVYVNGEKLCTAGVGSDGVLNSIVNVLGRDPHGYDIHIRVGGLENDEFLKWAYCDLRVGDEIRIKVIEPVVSDAPIGRKPNPSA